MTVAHPLPRIPNGSKTDQSQRQHCKWCCDEGVVPVGTERRDRVRRKLVPVVTGGKEWKMVVDGHYDVEVWGPCPMCEIGFSVEYPENSKWPWGGQGYWKGRPTVFEKQCTCGSKPSTKQEALAGIAEMKKALAGGFPSPDDPPRVRERTAPVPNEGRVAPAPKTEPVAPEDQHHRCPTYEGKDMPWPRSQCEACNPTTSEATLL